MRGKQLLLAIAPLLLLACDPKGVKPAPDPQQRVIELFKAYPGVRFQGTILNRDVSWRFDNWNNGIGTSTGTCPTGEERIQYRNSSIYDYHKREEIYIVTIESPAFCIDSSYAFKKALFAPGSKEIRRSRTGPLDGFTVNATSPTNCYSTLDGDQSESTLEVIRLEEVPPFEGMPDFKKIRVWMVVNCSLYHCLGTKAGAIKNGLFCLEFEVDRNQ